MSKNVIDVSPQMALSLGRFSKWLQNTRGLKIDRELNIAQMEKKYQQIFLALEFYLSRHKDGNAILDSTTKYDFNNPVFDGLIETLRQYRKSDLDDGMRQVILEDILTSCVNSGRNLNKSDARGVRPIDTALTNKDFTFLTAMKNAGADLSATNKLGSALIHQAVQMVIQGRFTLDDLEQLLALEVDVNTLTNIRLSNDMITKLSALDFAFGTSGTKELQNYLKEHDAKHSSELSTSLYETEEEVENKTDETPILEAGLHQVSPKLRDSLYKFFSKNCACEGYTMKFLNLMNDKYTLGDCINDFRNTEISNHFWQWVIHIEDIDQSEFLPFLQGLKKYGVNIDLSERPPEYSPKLLEQLRNYVAWHADSVGLTLADKKIKDYYHHIDWMDLRPINFSDSFFDLLIPFAIKKTADSGNIDIFDAVLDLGSNYVGSKGITPLQNAIAFTLTDIVISLVKHGHGICEDGLDRPVIEGLYQVEDKYTLLKLFETDGLEEEMKKQLEVQDPVLKLTPLFLFAKNSWYDLLEKAHEFGADLTIKDASGENLLHYALHPFFLGRANQDDIIKTGQLLIKHGVDISARGGKNNKSPIGHAMELGLTDLVKAWVAAKNNKEFEAEGQYSTEKGEGEEEQDGQKKNDNFMKSEDYKKAVEIFKKFASEINFSENLDTTIGGEISESDEGS